MEAPQVWRPADLLNSVWPAGGAVRRLRPSGQVQGERRARQAASAQDAALAYSAQWPQLGGEHPASPGEVSSAHQPTLEEEAGAVLTKSGLVAVAAEPAWTGWVFLAEPRALVEREALKAGTPSDQRREVDAVEPRDGPVRVLPRFPLERLRQQFRQQEPGVL